MKIKKEVLIISIFALITITSIIFSIKVNASVAVPPCRDVLVGQGGTVKPNWKCSNISSIDYININITAKSNWTSNFTINFSGNLIPTGSTIRNICVTHTLVTNDTAILKGLNITYWKNSITSVVGIKNVSVFSSTSASFTYCNNTWITTAADANAIRVSYFLLGDSTASKDFFEFDYVYLNITYNQAPKITNVTLTKPSWSITEGGSMNLDFSFRVTDNDTLSDLNPTGANATINATYSGNTTRFTNSTCRWVANSSDTANFTCTVQVWYWALNGTWSINASICDASSACIQNTSANFTLGATPSIQIAPGAINFGSLTVGTNNNTATDDPILINNSGNVNISVGNIRVTANDLAGADTKTIGAANFSVGISTGTNAECDFSSGGANKTTNATVVNVAGAGLPRMNISTSNLSTEQLYFCYWPTVPTYLTIQTYNTNAGGAWTIGVV